MRTRLLFSSSILAIVLVLSGCQEDPEQAANKLFVEASALHTGSQDFSANDPEQIQKRRSDLEQVLAKIETIVSDYPESSLAVEIVSTGAARGLSREAIAEEIEALDLATRCLQEYRVECVDTEVAERLAELSQQGALDASDVPVAMAYIHAIGGNVEKAMSYLSTAEPKNIGRFAREGVMIPLLASGEIQSFGDLIAAIPNRNVADEITKDGRQEDFDVFLPVFLSNGAIEAGRFTEALDRILPVFDSAADAQGDRAKEELVAVMGSLAAKVVWEMPEADLSALSQETRAKLVSALAVTSELIDSGAARADRKSKGVLLIAQARLGDAEALQELEALAPETDGLDVVVGGKAASLFPGSKVFTAWLAELQGSNLDVWWRVAAAVFAKDGAEAAAAYVAQSSSLNRITNIPPARLEVNRALEQAFVLTIQGDHAAASDVYRAALPVLQGDADAANFGYFSQDMHPWFVATMVEEGAFVGTEELRGLHAVPVPSGRLLAFFGSVKDAAATHALKGRTADASDLFARLLRVALDSGDDALLMELLKPSLPRGGQNDVFLPRAFELPNP